MTHRYLLNYVESNKSSNIHFDKYLIYLSWMASTDGSRHFLLCFNKSSQIIKIIIRFLTRFVILCIETEITCLILLTHGNFDFSRHKFVQHSLIAEVWKKLSRFYIYIYLYKVTNFANLHSDVWYFKKMCNLNKTVK